jgi:hypothetical protein
MGHGRVHWSANFDEIQDFEHDIRNAFGGTGFLSDAQLALAGEPLGAPKAGRSADLDALAAYVASLGSEHLPRSAARPADGSKSSAALRGAGVFAAEGCASCHAGGVLTDSSLDAELLHDVGTLSTSSGQRLGAALPGIDTPTLLSLASSAPYLHDGSAATLDDVFARAGAVVLQAEEAAFVGDCGPHGPDYGGLYHTGEVVRCVDGDDRVRFENVDGGAGGTARLVLRAAALYGAQTATLRVNGVAQPLPIAMTANDPGWWPTAFRNVALDVALAAGATNTIELSAPNDRIAFDDLSVTNASDFAAAFAHRRVLALAAGDRNDLLQHLLELDGSDDPTPAPEPHAVLGALAALGALVVRARSVRRR